MIGACLRFFLRRRHAERGPGQERAEREDLFIRHAPRNALRAGGWRVPELVELAQDVDRLGAQAAVERAPVGLGELAGPVVELGVADLAVLRVRAASSSARSALSSPRPPRAPAPQRRATTQHHEGEHDEDEQEVHSEPVTARPSSRATRAA